MKLQWVYMVHEGGELDLPLFVGTVSEIMRRYNIGMSTVTEAERKGFRLTAAGGYVDRIYQEERGRGVEYE